MKVRILVAAVLATIAFAVPSATRASEDACRVHKCTAPGGSQGDCRPSRPDELGPCWCDGGNSGGGQQTACEV